VSTNWLCTSADVGGCLDTQFFDTYTLFFAPAPEFFTVARGAKITNDGDWFNTEY
jgi:hypothetical protein